MTMPRIINKTRDGNPVRVENLAVSTPMSRREAMKKMVRLVTKMSARKSIDGPLYVVSSKGAVVAEVGGKLRPPTCLTSMTKTTPLSGLFNSPTSIAV